VATVSEPWLLIPFMYTLKQEGVAAEYGHRIMVKAIEDFCRELPRGSEDYPEEIRNLALRLYAKATPDGATYFLDKNPRYHLIVDDLFRPFPDSRLRHAELAGRMGDRGAVSAEAVKKIRWRSGG
jgi:hypothetical protein